MSPPGALRPSSCPGTTRGGTSTPTPIRRALFDGPPCAVPQRAPPPRGGGVATASLHRPAPRDGSPDASNPGGRRAGDAIRVLALPRALRWAADPSCGAQRAESAPWGGGGARTRSPLVRSEGVASVPLLAVCLCHYSSSAIVSPSPLFARGSGTSTSYSFAVRFPD
jgi:hypothetical protein